MSAPENQTPASPEQKQKKSKAGLAFLAAVLATEVAVLGTFFFQEPVVGAAQSGNVERVNSLATVAGIKADAVCSVEGLAAQTYDDITDLYENRVFFRHAPYMAGGLADTLEQLAEHKIVVRSATDSLGLYASAYFQKGGAGVPDTLLLSPSTRYNEKTAEFFDKVLADAKTMAPGAKLVLHDDFVKHSGELYQGAVAVPAGAQEYRVMRNENPFPSGGRPYPVPQDKCLPR